MLSEKRSRTDVQHTTTCLGRRLTRTAPRFTRTHSYSKMCNQQRRAGAYGRGRHEEGEKSHKTRALHGLESAIQNERLRVLKYALNNVCASGRGCKGSWGELDTQGPEPSISFRRVAHCLPTLRLMRELDHLLSCKSKSHTCYVPQANLTTYPQLTLRPLLS